MLLTWAVLCHYDTRNYWDALRIHAMYMWKRKRQVGFIYPSSCTRLPNAHVYKLCRKFAQLYNYTCSIFLHTSIFPLPINWKIHKKQYGIWTTYFKRYDTQVFFFSQWQVKNQFNKMKWQNPGPYLYSSHCVTVLIISFNWNYDSPQKSPTETSLM